MWQNVKNFVASPCNEARISGTDPDARRPRRLASVVKPRLVGWKKSYLTGKNLPRSKLCGEGLRT